MQAAFYLLTGMTWVMVALMTGRGHHLTRDQLLSWEVAVSGGLGSATTDLYVGMLTALMTAVAWCVGTPTFVRQRDTAAANCGSGCGCGWVCDSGMLLVPVVGRARLCWDFAATVYILHLLFCTLYTRFPYGQGGWEWWSRQVRSAPPSLLLL